MMPTNDSMSKKEFSRTFIFSVIPPTEPFALAHQSRAICPCPSKLSHLSLPSKLNQLLLPFEISDLPWPSSWINCHCPLSWATIHCLSRLNQLLLSFEPSNHSLPIKAKSSLIVQWAELPSLALQESINCYCPLSQVVFHYLPKLKCINLHRPLR